MVMIPAETLAETKIAKINTGISISMHPTSIEQHRAVLDASPGTAASMAAGKSAMNNLYTGLSQMTELEQATRQQFPSGDVIDGTSRRVSIQPERAAILANQLSQKFLSVARAFDASLAVVHGTTEKLSTAIDRALTSTKRDSMSSGEAQDIRDISAGSRTTGA